MGEIPRKAVATDMVLAVNWPPQAPAPGQAASSISRSSSSVMFPAAWAPTASYTSCSVIASPRYRPAAMEPP